MDREIGIDYREEKFYFGVFLGNEIVGYVYFKIVGGRCYIDEIIIKEGFRRRGIGTKILEWLENFARERGCHKMLLKTTEKHQILNLTRKLGYRGEAMLRDDAFHLDWIYVSKWI